MRVDLRLKRFELGVFEQKLFCVYGLDEMVDAQDHIVIDLCEVAEFVFAVHSDERVLIGRGGVADGFDEVAELPRKCAGDEQNHGKDQQHGNEDQRDLPDKIAVDVSVERRFVDDAV